MVIGVSFCSEIEREFSSKNGSIYSLGPEKDRLLSNIKQSIKFKIPDSGKILGLSQKDCLSIFSSDVGRLPFEKVVLEYSYPNRDAVVSGKNYVSKVCLIATEIEEDGERMIHVDHFNYFADFGCWTPYFASGVFSSRGFQIRPNFNNILNLPIDHATEEVLSECTVLGEFLMALSCKNVNIDKEASSRISKSYSRRRKPIYTYKTLTIDTSISGNEDFTGDSFVGRAGPRLHLRRGHIRRLKTGNVWVNSCVVGDKSIGLVVKDYAVI